MITGDKQETAINIAIACKLVHHIKDLLIVNAHQSEEAAKARLQDLLALCKASNPGGGRGTVSVKVGLKSLPCISQPFPAGQTADWGFSCGVPMPEAEVAEIANLC